METLPPRILAPAGFRIKTDQRPINGHLYYIRHIIHFL